MTQYETKDSGERVEFDSGMRRDVETGKPRFDLLRPPGVPYLEQFLTRCAALLGRGADKYGDRNWEKANSQAELDRFKSSAARHFEQWFNGEEDEDHAAAVFFNLLAHETIEYKMNQGEGDFQRFVDLLNCDRPSCSVGGDDAPDEEDGDVVQVNVVNEEADFDWGDAAREALWRSFDRRRHQI